MTFNPTTLSNISLLATAFSAAFLSALWLGVIIWTFRDIRNRSTDPFLRILSLLLVTILFLPGIVIYWLIRPGKTMEEEYQQTLEEEALLQTIEDIPLCPGCGRKTQNNWIVCPNCHTKLKKKCHQCQELMELAWNICPCCSTPEPGMRMENYSMDEALKSLPPSDVEPLN
ncbi:MAG: zinc ribbon domain-containing protein [Anaerolineaceae bacterium]|nr:zinc ribbon domain-containing protein [Anaerolineaceae bacterium]